VFLDPNDTPAVKRTTLTGMLNRAAALQAAGNGRGSTPLKVPDPTGLIVNAAGMLQFSGEWGFVLGFGSPAQGAERATRLVPPFHSDDDDCNVPSWSWNDLVFRLRDSLALRSIASNC
jgi:hypothetical protein